MSAGYIYLLLADGTNPKRYKIGLTNNPERRLSELNQKQSPYPIRMLQSIPVADMHQSESQLHQQWSNYRRHGEWFEFPDSLISDVRESIANHKWGGFYTPQLKSKSTLLSVFELPLREFFYDIPLKYKALTLLLLLCFGWGFIRGITLKFEWQNQQSVERNE